MPTPFAPRLILPHNARADLHALLRAHSTPQWLALRARIVLRAADLDRPSNLAISREVGCDHHTVGQWRRRYLALGLSGLPDAVRSGRPTMIAAPTRVHVLAVASILPQEQERPGTRWTLDEIATTVCETLHIDPLRRASIWRILHEVALQPQKRADGLNSHDEDCDAQAHAIHRLYVKALEGYEQGRLGICCDEKPTCKCWSVKPPPSPRNRGGASAARMRTYAMAHTS